MASSPHNEALIQRELFVARKELKDLQTGLDAHAIVAITDRHGVILQVNEKFCEISQYSRNELIGQTHRVIKSDHHDAGFFQDLWRTISTGQVWQGEICNRAKDGSLYWVATTIVPLFDAVGQLTRFLSLRSDITRRVQAEQEAKRMAFFDPLTQLPNRRMLADRIREASQRALDEGHLCALMILDFDYFKEINDTLGHNRGDMLLRQAAERLVRHVREPDTVARLGGDEFVILLNRLNADIPAASEEALLMAESIRLAMGKSFICDDNHVHGSVSLGVTLFRGGARQHNILKQADMALYRAKSRGRNQACLFDASLQFEVEEHAKLMASLRLAVIRQEFRLFYQPIVDAHGTLEGYEALLRWEHPEQGLVSPAGFINQLESSGLILPVGKWVLRTACEQLNAWSTDPATARLSLSVNVSARQLQDAKFASDVEKALNSTGADPRLLRLELTESSFHNDVRQLISKMNMLRRRGIRFSLDDFGTGYSSLSYLKTLPLDRLKIDQSFIRNVLIDISDAAIVQSIIKLALILGLDVVAEGVETEEQAEFLRRNDCSAFQGYLFGKPQPLTRPQASAHTETSGVQDSSAA